MKKYFFLLTLSVSVFQLNLSAQQSAYNFIGQSYVNPKPETTISLMLRSGRGTHYYWLKNILATHGKETLGDIKDSLAYEMKKLDALQLQVSNSQKNVSRLAGLLNIPQLANPSNINPQIETISQTLSSAKLYGALILLLLGFVMFRLYMEMQRKLQVSNEILDSRISLAKNELERYVYELEKEAVRIDNKLVQVLHEQLSIIKEEKNYRLAINPIEQFIPNTDHRLPIKVGEEIHRMRKRIDNMDKEVKGLGALVNSIKRLEEELTGNGYEMEDLMGKKYVDGMKMEARFVDNPEIPPGEERITDVLRPEIKYKGEVIQVAKVEVGKSY